MIYLWSPCVASSSGSQPVTLLFLISKSLWFTEATPSSEGDGSLSLTDMMTHMLTWYFRRWRSQDYNCLLLGAQCAGTHDVGRVLILCEQSQMYDFWTVSGANVVGGGMAVARHCYAWQRWCLGIFASIKLQQHSRLTCCINLRT